MVKSHTLKFQSFPSLREFLLIFLLLIFCPLLWASQDAMVIVDKALIYSDKEMTSPIGYVIRGKKLKVGDIARNKAQVYPIVVSGKIAYIRVLDVTTERESMDSTRLTAERFQKATKDAIPESKFVVSYYSFLSTVDISRSNGELQSNDPVSWHGLSMKGEALVLKRADIGLFVNYMGTDEGEEHFRVLETGISAALRMIDHKKFLARVEAQVMAIPFSSYELGGEFRVRSFGFSTGGGLNLTYLFNKHWGVEAYGGAYYTRLLAFDVPDPYTDFSATFVGGRFGIGLNYTY